MNMRQVLLGTAMVLGSAGMANAAAPDGWYMNLGGGVNWVEDGDIDEFTAGGSPQTTNSFRWETGYIIAGAVGYDFGRWRAELEIAFRKNDVDNFLSSGFGPYTAAGADLWELSQMVNVLYDIALGGRWEASVGAGIGGNLVVFNPGCSGNFESENCNQEADDYVLAGQLIAQAAYRLAERWQLYLDYRFMFMDDPEVTNPGDGEIWEIEKTEHALMIGVRFDLQQEGAPPPPAPAPATPAPAPQEFIVFFGFNKANLTAEAARVVAEAAEAAKETGAVILVIGHTDTSGSPSYNLSLSIRRADAVKGGLMDNGVPGDMITTSGKGEDEPMVQTGDGVKEPQNRRAVIVIKIRTS